MIKSSYASRFLDRFREDSHQLIFDGFQRARSRITRNQKEDEITGLIAEEIDNIFTDSATPIRFRKFYSIEEQPPLRDPLKKKKGLNRSRADIRVRTTSLLPPARYLFEAKRLSTRSHPSSGYLGQGGVHQLLNDASYVMGAVEACMIGYVQNKDIPYWLNDLHVNLNGSFHSILNTTSGFSSCQILSSMPDTKVSTHTNSSNEKVSIYHILLDCVI